MGRTRWDALVGVVLTFAACLSLGEIIVESHADDPCATNSDCGSCLQQNGCGWCGFPQGCKAGNASGDNQGTCYLSWVFGRSCPDCASFTNCGDCLKQDYLCGWCGPSQTCITPTYNKTSNRLVAPTCPKDFSNGMEIPCPDCSRGTSCKTCAALDEASGRCGWCDAKQACVEGNRNGPFIFKDACLSWDYLACPFCQYHDNCYDCTHEPNCGWCPAGHAQCLTQGINHTLTCPTAWAAKTSQCENPYPWNNLQPGPESGFSIDVVDVGAMIVGGLFLAMMFGILVYLGLRKYRRFYGHGTGYRRVDSYAVSS